MRRRGREDGLKSIRCARVAGNLFPPRTGPSVALNQGRGEEGERKGREEGQTHSASRHLRRTSEYPSMNCAMSPAPLWHTHIEVSEGVCGRMQGKDERDQSQDCGASRSVEESKERGSERTHSRSTRT